MYYQEIEAKNKFTLEVMHPKSQWKFSWGKDFVCLTC